VDCKRVGAKLWLFRKQQRQAPRAASSSGLTSVPALVTAGSSLVLIANPKSVVREARVSSCRSSSSALGQSVVGSNYILCSAATTANLRLLFRLLLVNPLPFNPFPRTPPQTPSSPLPQPQPQLLTCQLQYAVIIKHNVLWFDVPLVRGCHRVWWCGCVTL